GNALRSVAAQYGVDSLEITGVCTDICVLHTAIRAYNLGYPVTVHDNRVASFNALGHTWAMAHFKETLGFNVVKEEEA
ncbi:cysteine hydrolase family protein, partial [Eubacterium aggregans]|uniref:cysteine hydrolase family protein n=1 Tax=Eubacterium aggregans TaxID=81409 RepID=UPI003F34446A